MRDRLIELVKKAHDEQKYLTSDKSINAIADYLLDNGVIVLPCKVGQTVYFVHKAWDENADEYFGNRIDSCGSILLVYGYYERADNQGACV